MPLTKSQRSRLTRQIPRNSCRQFVKVTTSVSKPCKKGRFLSAKTGKCRMSKRYSRKRKSSKRKNKKGKSKSKSQ